jgi:TonB family protein
MLTLAQLHLDGRSVPRDDARGAELLRTAADDLKDASARLRYAQLLYKGRGVEKDEAAAEHRLNLLAESGFLPARAALGQLMLGGGLDDAAKVARARALFRQGAESGEATARLYHALMCLEAFGGPRDFPTALRELHAAAATSDGMAPVFLAGVLAQGDEATGLRRDEAEARRVLAAAAAKKNTVAARYLQQMDEGEDIAALLTGRRSIRDPAALLPAEPVEEETLPLERVPRPLFQARPLYPLAMRYLGLGGEVIVEFTVSPLGVVVDARSLQSTARGFEAAAVAAVERWRFKPGVKDHRPVPTSMRVPITFTMNEPVVEQAK